MKKITGNKLTDLQHLLSIDEMDISLINDIFKSADKFLKNNQSIAKYKILQGKTVCNLFLKIAQEHKLLLRLLQKGYPQMLSISI